MCGICGAVALDADLAPAIADALPAMTDALEHRGPDGEGHYRSPRAVLGHRRLAIIDRAGGSQPIANEDGSCWVVLNGEIYNHVALRRDLEARGHRFRTVSDTEVAVHAYEEFGPAAAAKFDGMFALAVYDERRQSLWLARDRLGKKPLFYTSAGGALHFASELSALRRSPAWHGEIDAAALDAYLRLGYVPAPRTIFRGVRKLPAGCWLQLARGQERLQQYWDVDVFDDDHRPAGAICDEVDALIDRAVRDRLESEVPLGAFLSGGIDSGLVVSALAGARAGVTTTTVGFAGRDHNELAAAAQTARHLDTDHHEAIIAIDAPAITRVLDTLDEPLADPSIVPTFYVAEMARRHVTVALTGDGGDEAFGGYGFRYVPHALEAVLRPASRWLPGAALRRLALDRRGARRMVRGAAVLRNLSLDPAGAYFADLCRIDGAHVDEVCGTAIDVRHTFAYDAATAPYRSCGSTSALQRAMYADLKGYMVDDVLAKVDRMSMRHGLEVRCPLLDHRIIERAFRVPARIKMPRGRTKDLLRRLAARRLPPAIAGLPKQGFSAPASAWMANGCRPLFDAEVLVPSSFVATRFDLRAVRRFAAEHAAGAADHGRLLWALWTLERWAARLRQP